jgi:penicillin-binding protein 2
MLESQTLKNRAEEYRLFQKRTIIMGACLAFLILLLVTRLFYLDVTKFQQYQTLSKKNQLNIIPLPPTRGLIYDRNGVLLAKNIPVHSLEIIPEKIKHMDQTLAAIKHLLPTITDEDIKLFYKSMHQHRRFDSVPLKLKLSDKDVARFAVNQYLFPGVMIKARLMRSYPLGKDTAHVLGFVGRINSTELKTLDKSNYSGTNFIGKVGIEKYYEETLHGKVGYQQVEIDASGRTVRAVKKTSSKSGGNLYLSLDSRLQKVAEKALKDHQGSVVAIDPNTGEVLALVSVPSYDPNAFVQGITQKDYNALAQSNTQPLYNRAIRGQYPLASTIKPFISVSALDKKIVDLKHRIYDRGWFQLPNNDHLFRDWKRQGHGWVNLQRALVISCDTYFYQLAYLMGIQKIDDILSEFGFGHNTEIDMGEELPGLIPSPQWKQIVKHTPWYTGDTLISGIGQGFMLTTPLQLASATARLALRGKHFRPHLLLKIKNNNRSVPNPIIESYPLNLKNSTSWQSVIEAMEAVVTHREGTGHRFGRHPGYSVAIKTGTAQVYSIKQNETSPTETIPDYLRDHSLFIGFAPVDKPRIALAVLVENAPIAGNVARKVMDSYLLGK